MTQPSEACNKLRPGHQGCVHPPTRQLALGGSGRPPTLPSRVQGPQGRVTGPMAGPPAGGRATNLAATPLVPAVQLPPQRQSRRPQGGGSAAGGGAAGTAGAERRVRSDLHAPSPPRAAGRASSGASLCDRALRNRSRPACRRLRQGAGGESGSPLPRTAGRRGPKAAASGARARLGSLGRSGNSFPCEPRQSGTGRGAATPSHGPSAPRPDEKDFDRAGRARVGPAHAREASLRREELGWGGLCGSELLGGQGSRASSESSHRGPPESARALGSAAEMGARLRRPVPAPRRRPPSRRGPALLVTLGRGRGAGSLHVMRPPRRALQPPPQFPGRLMDPAGPSALRR